MYTMHAGGSEVRIFPGAPVCRLQTKKLLFHVLRNGSEAYLNSAFSIGLPDSHQIVRIRASHVMCINLLVAPGLKLKQVGVLPIHREQAFVIPLFEDFAIVDDDDPISGAYR